MSRSVRSALLAGIAVVLLAGVACGRYGPPRRIQATPVTPAPATATTPADPAETPAVEPDPEP